MKSKSYVGFLKSDGQSIVFFRIMILLMGLGGYAWYSEGIYGMYLFLFWLVVCLIYFGERFLKWRGIK